MVERKHPEWIKVRAPVSPEYFRTRAMLAELKLHTVCQEACCPNIGECFGHRTATFMLMGDVFTRNCPYCAVAHGKTRPLDPDEPRRIGEAVARLGLQHVVVTSVDRDDLADGCRDRTGDQVDDDDRPRRSAGSRFQGRARKCRYSGLLADRYLQP
jgi:lipoic acid synthetase